MCEGCVYGKQNRVSHPVNPKIREKPLDMIHVDLCEINVNSLRGAKYFLLFKDDYTHYRTVYFLKNKNEKLDIYMKLVENQFGREVKRLRSDQGTEIKNGSTKENFNNLVFFTPNLVLIHRSKKVVLNAKIEH